MADSETTTRRRQVEGHAPAQRHTDRGDGSRTIDARRLLGLGTALLLLLAACRPASAPAAPASPVAAARQPASVAEAAPAPDRQAAEPAPTPTAGPASRPAVDPTSPPAVEPTKAPVTGATESTAGSLVGQGSAEPATQDAPLAEGIAPVLFTRYDTAAAFATGAHDGTQLDGDVVSLAPGLSTGTWVSPLVDPGFPFARLVASWNAQTPAGSWVRIEVQATTATEATTDWYTLATWAEDESVVQRASVNGQSDAHARVATDTLLARDQPLAGYRLRVTLGRSAADAPAPKLSLIGAVVSESAAAQASDASPAGPTEPVELPVPAYSQEIHAGHFPQWGGGGEVWCSPTSTQMVIEYWGKGPTADELGWVGAGHANPSVDFAARATYDAAYRGTGNWPFNTAYAARYGLKAFVTQLRSLAEAEQLIRAGIPLAASIKVAPRQLDGFLFAGGTNGHLVVIVGFDADGNPIVNDPAAWSNDTVRRVYDRAQFERAWLGGSGGIVYVIHPPEVPLPPPPAGATPNW